MGEVYQARDTRLGRSVAIKILPDQFAADANRRERFEREARAVSSLNHPHICTLYDVGQQDGIYYLVMELIEGETLESRLRHGRLPLNGALKYAVQIAGALAKAHGRGVVHRDLKPGNIMITRSGVKLLDFGLAKFEADTPANTAISQVQTNADARQLTGEGTILGTLQYMAPEQIEGKEADARADIFSLGVVAYEMFSGRKAFHADSPARLAAAILTSEPPPLSSASDAPPALGHLVHMCLAKDPTDRWQTAHDVAKQLEWIDASGAASTTSSSSSGRGIWLGAAAVLVALAAVGVWFRPRPAAPGPPMRLALTLPEHIRFTVGEDFLRSAVISPDGERVAFTGVERDTGRTLIYVRPIGAVEATALEGTHDGSSIFWSPDSNAVGFFAEGRLQYVGLTGGPPKTVAAANSNGGASWNDDDVILASLQNPGPIVTVPLAGGTPVPVTTLDPSAEVDHDWPQFLDDGEHFLYMAWGRTTAQNQVFVGALGSQTRTRLLTGVTAFAFASPDRVIFLEAGTLLTQAFDTKRLELVGKPVPVAKNALSPLSASRAGPIIYRTIPAVPNPMVWLHPDGRVIGPALPPGYYIDPAVSPNGSEIAYAHRESRQGTFDISIMTVATGAVRPLTLNAATDRAPVWSPDGASIVYLSLRQDAPGLYRKRADGAGGETLILPSPGVVWPYQWVGDRIVHFAGTVGANDLYTMSPNNPDTPKVLVKTPFNDVDGAISPDGQWFVYTTNETGRWELVMTTFPTSSTKLHVTTQGGVDPIWNRDGTELFYVKPSTAELMSVPVVPGNPPRFLAHRRLYSGPLWYPNAHSFDLDLRGNRILVAPSFDPGGDITVLVNWRSLSTQ